MSYVKLTGFSHKGYTKLHYDCFGTYSGKNIPKPHQTEYGYDKRVLGQYGINCRANNFNGTVKDFERFKPKHRKNETINIVIGFKNSEINCHKRTDRLRAIRYGIKFVHLVFGKNAQALITLQHDSHEPHLHITINNCNIKTLHAIPGSQRSLSRLQITNQKMIRAYNHQHPSHLMINPLDPNYKSSDNSLFNKVAKKFNHALSMPSNDSKRAIRSYMKNKYHIRVRFIRPNKRTSRRHHRKHKHYGIVLIPRGQHPVKASSIGIKYNSVIHQLYVNRSHQRSIRHTKAKARSASSASMSTAISQYASQRADLYHDESEDGGDDLVFDWTEADSLDSSAKGNFGNSFASISASVSSAVETSSAANSFASQDEREAREYINERKSKHDKKIKQAKQRRFDRQLRRFNRQARIQEQCLNRSKRTIDKSKQGLASGGSLISRFTHKISSKLSTIFRSAVSKIKEVIRNHNQKKLINNRQNQKHESDEIQP